MKTAQLFQADGQEKSEIMQQIDAHGHYLLVEKLGYWVKGVGGTARKFR